VCTTFVGGALLDAYEKQACEQQRDQRCLDQRCLTMAVGAAEYILNDLYWTDGARPASVIRCPDCVAKPTTPTCWPRPCSAACTSTPARRNFWSPLYEERARRSGSNTRMGRGFTASTPRSAGS